MKSDWKKDEKQLYLPGREPCAISVPSLPFFLLEGKGNPNTPEFGLVVQSLYSLSYTVKMSPRAGFAPAGYEEYCVYPLEGVWDVTDEAKKNFIKLDKNDFTYTIMIRQPAFVTPEFAALAIERAVAKKPELPIRRARFETLEEGLCVQMFHIGSYDDEPASFARMEEFCRAQGLERASKTHREIYVSDPGKTAPERLITVLRFRARRV
jgi:hypothetical protein